ncbi:hypothetical protein G6F36_013555 [Rhizopus arrhizus]|nr:hypothetical protein G6F36_013555 [Rhizopus arrhizus]
MYRYDQPSPGLSISQTDLSLKRSQHFEDEESASFSWHSADKKRKSNYIDAYTSSCYSKTDFGDKDDKYPQWMINNLNMTKVLKEYRQITENGTQMGKHLSDIRILSLSYIFLISEKKHCSLSRLLPEQQLAVMKALNLKQYLEFMEDDVLIACRKIQKSLYNEDMDEEEREVAIDLINNSSNSRHIKTAVKIAKDIIPHIFSNKFLNRQEGEANQIIELLRLFLIHCWTSRLTGVKLTYHLLPTRLHSSSESMIPDYVLFSEPYSSITFDLCFVE